MKFSGIISAVKSNKRRIGILCACGLVSGEGRA